MRLTAVCQSLIALLLIFSIPSPDPASAQALTTCGLPAQGSLWQTVTYTLTSDCVLTGTLNIATATPALSVTVNGGGFAISGGAATFFRGPMAVLNLYNVTIDGGEVSRTSVLSVSQVTASNVTIKGSASGSAVAGDTNFSNVLLEENSSGAFHLAGNGSAVHANPNTTHVWNNVVLRRNYGSGGAISLRPGATLTTTGCLTLSGNVPYDIYNDNATWTDSSTGACSGTTGNGDPAVIPAPGLMDCGLPAAGNWDTSATYTLTADCEISGITHISENVDIRIVGNGRSLRSSIATYQFITAATSSLRLENLVLDGVRFYNWGEIRADNVRATNTSGGFIANMGVARVSNGVFENNQARLSTSRSVLMATSAYQSGYTSIRDSTFRNNRGGQGVLQNLGATIELFGCVIFQGNTPADFSGTIIDNRDTDCDAGDSVPLNSTGGGSARSRFDNCDIGLGAIGVICRPPGQPHDAVVFRINEDSVGIFMLEVTQQQIEATSGGLVACSPDRRVAVRVGLTPAVYRLMVHSRRYQEPRKRPVRDILISKGPNFEGKVHNVVIDRNLEGHVLGTVDTYDGLPCPPVSVSVSRTSARRSNSNVKIVRAQPAQADGSIVHVVEPGDTTYMIALAYGVRPAAIVTLNRLSNSGRLIIPGRTLLIREAD